MISTVSSVIRTYQPARHSTKLAMIQADIVAKAVQNKEIIRETAAEKSLSDARLNYLQTQYVGPARAAAQLAALSNQSPFQQNGEYVGPARDAARNDALGAELSAVKSTQNYYQDLRSGCFTGPKPASAIAADQRQREMLNQVA